ncbi:flagellar hook-basal body complex protein FliE [Sporolactobacillus sp. THM7-4]|nr:flagellar hook-basal body complex protein FliE [Sporolactobacillus sp. THM7-4]
MSGIDPINLNQSAGLALPVPHSAAQAQNSFAKTLANALTKVNESQQTANQMVTNLANGSSDEDLHNVMIAMQKANILLKTTVQVRDRVIDAYQEMMRMQV